MKNFKFLLTFSFWLLLISFNANGQDEETPEAEAKASTKFLAKIIKMDSLTAQKVYVCYLDFYKERSEIYKERNKESIRKNKEKLVQTWYKLENHLKEVFTTKQYEDYKEYIKSLEKCIDTAPRKRN